MTGGATAGAWIDEAAGAAGSGDGAEVGTGSGTTDTSASGPLAASTEGGGAESKVGPGGVRVAFSHHAAPAVNATRTATSAPHRIAGGRVRIGAATATAFWSAPHRAQKRTPAQLG
jgi:hypothetical protein